MTSAQIRQSFLDFFKEKQHTIVPSSSLLPDSPNLLFTNAGMNQFVPIFLGQQSAPWKPPRTADTQKCIRAGGKHNDLDDVGLDTYHHTFFEMLGNWSFGDYFKKEAIEWAWELVVERWGLPPNGSTPPFTIRDPGDPSEFDQEAYDHLGRLFRARGSRSVRPHRQRQQEGQFLDDGRHRPLRPVLRVARRSHPERRHARLAGQRRRSALHRDLESGLHPVQRECRTAPSRRCPRNMSIPAWVSSASPRSFKARRASRIFRKPISNYETDVFRPIFDEIEKLSGKRYDSTLPKAGSTGDNEQEKIDVAFRVIADHIRTLSFAIADGIQPSNEGRGYVLRRILRRAVRYGRTLGFHEPFFYQTRRCARPIRWATSFRNCEAKADVQDTLRREEEAFNRTLDKGIGLFQKQRLANE